MKSNERNLSQSKLLYFLTLYAVFKVLNTPISLDAFAFLETEVEAKEERIFSRFNRRFVLFSAPLRQRRREILY